MTVTLSEQPTDVEYAFLADARSAIDDLVGDRFKVEILDGRIDVSPLARSGHDEIVGELHLALGDQLDRRRYSLSQRIEFVVDESNHPQPDLAVISKELRRRTMDRTNYPASDALLVVEVTSPSNLMDDRRWGLKYKAYAKGMVPLYLLVDAHAPTGPELTLYSHPTGTRYNVQITVKFGEPLRLVEPFERVVIDSSILPVPEA